jgi:3-hydroxyisobutyrate dehydrogenase-like beta-hydroxyacid dehydrogenase
MGSKPLVASGDRPSLDYLAAQLYEAATDAETLDFAYPALPVTPAPDEAVGFYGVGDIGFPMAQRLLACGTRLTVLNRTAAKVDPLVAEGAVRARSEDDLLAAATTIITCLHGPEADRHVYLRDGGLLSGDVGGKLFVNTSTIGPELATELGARAASAGAGYLDAPLLGHGRYAALAGSLIIPVGGASADVDRAAGVLAAVGSVVEHVGEVGAGQVVKLAFNFQFAVASVALADAIRFALRGGAQPASLERILVESGRAATPIQSYTHRMVQHQHQRRGTLATLAKDLDVANAYAAAVGEPSSTGRAAAQSYRAGVDVGLGRLDVPALVHVRLDRQLDSGHEFREGVP